MKFKPNKDEKVSFYPISNKSRKPLELSEMLCPGCGKSKVKKPDKAFVGKCNMCGVFVRFFYPNSFQQLVYKCKNRVQVKIGGFGSGKTSLSCAKIVDHAQIYPGANVAIFAQTEDQVREIVLPALEEWIHPDMLDKKQTTKYKKVFRNGSVIKVYQSSEAQRIRSASFSAAWLVEASKINQDLYREIRGRLRHKAAVTYFRDDDGKIIVEKNKKTGRWQQKIKENNTLLLIESNPEPSWLRSELVMKAHSIFYTEEVMGINSLMKSCRIEKFGDDVYDMVVFLTSTYDNPFLADDYVATVAAGHTNDPEWIDRNLNADMSYNEGKVFPQAMEHFIEPFNIPKHWPIAMGVDLGWAHPTAVLWCAVNPKTMVKYFYLGYKEKEQSLDTLDRSISGYENYYSITENKLLFRVMDYSAKMRTQGKDGARSVDDDMRTYGYDFNVADKKREEGIAIVRTEFDRGLIKIFNNIKGIADEFDNYIWDPSKNGEVTIKKWDHYIDTLRYIIMEFKRFDKQGIDIARIGSVQDYDDAMINSDPLNLHESFSQLEEVTGTRFRGSSIGVFTKRRD